MIVILRKGGKMKLSVSVISFLLWLILEYYVSSENTGICQVHMEYLSVTNYLPCRMP